MESVQKTLKVDILKEIDEKRKGELNIIIIGLPECNDLINLIVIFVKLLIVMTKTNICDFCGSAYHIACCDMSDALFKALSMEVSI